MAGKEKTILQLDGEINLKADKAKQSMQELKNLLNEFKNKTIDVKAQTRSARMSIQNLGDFISRTFNKDNVVKLSTADAQAKADRLLSTLRSFKDFTKITLSLDAKGVSSQLQSIRNDLNFIIGKHTISLNATTAQVKSQLAGLSKDINNIKNVSFTINVKNNADLKGINTFTKDMSKLAGLKSDITFGITVKSVQNSLDRVRQVSNVLANLKNNNSIQFTESGLNPILGKLKNMELYLRSIKQNSKIKISAEGAKELPKLKVEADQSDLFAVEKRLAIIRAMIRQINRMTLKVNGRYNNRSGGGGSRGGRSAGDEQLGNRWFNSSFFTQFVHFVGRSSKGFGSFGEATADVLAKWQAAGGALGRFASIASVAAAGIAAFSAGITLVVGSLNVFANILTTIGRTIYTALQPGIELYKQQTSAVFSFTAALQSNAKYLDQPLSRNDARGLSQDLINRATLDAEMSAFSLEELLRSLQGTLPILLSRGMSLDQAYEVNKGVAGVAKMTQLTPSQILQETRDLAQGSITSRGSQVANALGITNADINKYKGDVEGLYNFLMEKFANYSELLQQYEDTALGRYQQLEERWQSVTKTLVDGVADQFKGVFEYLINATGQWVDKEGNILNALTGKWEDAQGNIFNKDKNQWENPLGEVVEKSVDNVGKNPVFQLSESLQKLIPLFQDIVNYTTELVDGFTEFVSKTFEGEDPIKVIKEFIFACLDGLFLCAKILVILIDSFVDARNESGSWLNVMDDIFVIIYNLGITGVRGFKEITLAIAGVIGAALKLGKILGPIITGIGLLHGNLVMAAAGASLTGAAMAVSDDIDAFIAEKDRLQEELHKEKPNYISSASDLLIKPKDGDLTKRVRQTQAEEEAKRVLDQARNQHLDPKSAKGTAQDKEDEKTRKKAIKDAQKVMKEHIQGLKEQLKDHIAELKETLAKNKIAFDEGFMTVKDFYTQKAQLETEEARLRLEEAQAEKAAILATPYENQADQLKALHSIEREIRQQTRAYNKGVQAQKEVAKAAERSSKAMELITGLFSGHDAVQTTPIVNQQQQQTVMSASTNQKAIESFASDVAVKNMGYVANEITNQAIAKLGNNERGWTLAKFANAIAAAESHYNQGAVSGAGAIGIMQLMPDTASSLGVNPYDWKQNIKGGIDYLYQQLETFGWDLRKAAAAYNAGPGAVKDYGGVPPYRETQGYVSRVTDYMGKIDSNGFNASTGGNAQVIQSASQTMLDQIGTLLVYNINEYVRKGIPYVWGGTSEAGFDCSGMVKYLFDQLGISIQRTADYQYDQMKAKGSIFDNKNWLLPGDLVFMRGSDPGSNGVGHVGIYAGNNQMVHMPGSGRQAEYANLDNRRDIVGYGSVRNYTYGTQIGQMMGQSVQTQVSSMVSNEVYGKLVDELLIGKSMEVIDALKKAAANVTETGSEADKALLNQVSDLVNLRAELDGRITGNQRSGVMKILMEYYKNLINAKQDENLIQAYTDKMMNDIRDQRKKVITDMFNFTLSDIEYKGNIVGNEILTGILNSEEKIADYFKKVFDVDPGNLFNPGNFYKQLEVLYREYEEKGELMSAVEIRNLLDEALKKVQNVIKGWIDKGLEYIDKQQAIFEADASFTNLQREFGNREFQAYKAEYEYGMRAKLADRLQDRFNNRNDEMKTLQSRLEAIKNITTDLYEKEIAMNSLEQDTTKVVAEKSRYLKEQSDIESRLQLIRGQRSDIEREKMLNDLELQRLKLLKEQPKYLTDIRNTAKQALEDGLVTFLTDGINEAENLGEALRNLAISFLKEIQQMSAKWMVKSLMNKWFGQFVFRSPEEISADNSSAALLELRTQTKLQSDIVSLLSGRAPLSNAVSANSAGAIASAMVTAGATTSLLVPTNSMLNMSYDQYMNKQKNPYSFSKEDLGLKDFTTGFKSSINEFKLSNDLNTQALNTTAQVNTALNATTQANTATTQADTVATQTQTAATQADTIATQSDTIATTNNNSLTQANNYELNRNSNEVSRNSNEHVQDRMSGGGGGTYSVGSSGGGVTGVAGAGSKAVSGFKGLGGGGFFNGGLFQNLLGTITDITGSALGQLAGDFLAIKAIFKGDTKEKLLGTIFLELQLLYMGQQQLIIWAQMASNWLQEIAFELQNISMGVRFATGGYVSGQGTSTSDSIPTMLSNGEYVIKASSVKKYGTNFLNAVNSGNFTKIKSEIPHYAQGGLVSDLAQEQTARGISNFGKDISNNISNTANISVALVRDEQEGMKQLLRSPEGQRIMLDFSRRYASVTSRF